MASRESFLKSGTLVLVVVFIGCYPDNVTSEISPSFKGLECSCGSNCTYGTQKCELIRCKCPYEAGDYAADLDYSDELRPDSCCEMFPAKLQSLRATHFMYSEKYEDYFGNESVRTVTVFTKLSGSTTARWSMTIIIGQTSRDQEQISVPQNVSFVESGGNPSMNNFLDMEGEIPDEFKDIGDDLDGSQGFLEPLQCDVTLNNTCDSEFYSCLIYPEDKPKPVVESFRNISEDNMVYDIGNDVSTLSTSSFLSHLTNIHVTKRPENTYGGWAPSYNDSDRWVKFSNVKANVCGLVIQGADWSRSRRLEKFSVETESGLVKSLNGNDYFLSGVLLYSKSIHLFSMPVERPKFLQINVIEPMDPLKVGFRASMVTCGSAVNACQGQYFVDSLKEEMDHALNNSAYIQSEDPIGVVSEFYNTLQEFLEQNFHKYASPGKRSFQYTRGDVGVDVLIVNIEDLQIDGYTFDTTMIDGWESEHDAIIVIPPEGVQTMYDDYRTAVVLASVVGHNNSEVHTDVDDVGRILYKFSSPIVSARVFINDSECSEVINNITVKMKHDEVTEGELAPYYFKEECVQRRSGKHVHWSEDGCEPTCNGSTATCQMKCSHLTSFAVLTLLDESKLSEAGKSAASIITTVGSVISILSLVAALLIYLILRSSIANAQYAIHSNLMISLLVSLCIFMALQIPGMSNIMCKTTMFLLQYFFSAAFCWMLCEGIHLYRQVITVFESGHAVKYIRMYFLLGWALPLSFVVVSMIGVIIRDSINSNSCCDESRKKPCFFSHEDGSIWFFLAPVLVVIVINTFILIRVTIVVVKAAKLQADRDSSQALYQAKAGLRSAFLLIPLLGCSYALGFFASFHGAFEIAYNVINSLQGFLLALFYCVMNKEVRSAVGKYIKRSRDMNAIQASTTGTNMTRFYSETSKRSKRNQVEPAAEPHEPLFVDDVD